MLFEKRVVAKATPFALESKHPKENAQLDRDTAQMIEYQLAPNKVKFPLTCSAPRAPHTQNHKK